MQKLKIIVDPNNTQEVLAAIHTLNLLLGDFGIKPFKVKRHPMSELIKCIKDIRTVTNWDLKPAKAYVDTCVQAGVGVIPHGIDRDAIIKAFAANGFEVIDD